MERESSSLNMGPTAFLEALSAMAPVVEGFFGCQARGTSCSRRSKSKPGRRGVTVMPGWQVEVGVDVRSSLSVETGRANHHATP